MRTRSAAIGLPALTVLIGCGGDRAIGRASEFVRAAQSVRIHAVDKESGPSGRRIQIACPDKVRIEADSSSGPLEIIAIGNTVVARTGDAGWIKAPMSFVNAPAVCVGSSWAEGRKDLGTVLSEMTRLVVSEVMIDPRQVNGVQCQDWEARERGPDPGGKKPRIRLCLAVDDQRPMELGLPDGTRWVFSDWNSPMDISLPTDGTE